MPLELKPPITYLVTSGKTTLQTTPNSPEFSNLLKLVEAAVDAGVSLIQLREKLLSTRVLEELTAWSVELTHRTMTRLLLNERFDVALSVGGDGVQLTSRSMPTEVVRSIVGQDFLIGVSTHSLNEVIAARDDGANFVLFGPVFETQSKREFGAPQGMSSLREVTTKVKPFPVIAIGGITVENAGECLDAGAAGVAAISMFEDASRLKSVVNSIQSL